MNPVAFEALSRPPAGKEAPTPYFVIREPTGNPASPGNSPPLVWESTETLPRT